MKKNLLLRHALACFSLLFICSTSAFSQSKTYFYLKLPSLGFQPTVTFDTVIAGDSSYALDFGNTEVDTIFAKYKIYRFEQSCPVCQKQVNREYFTVKCNDAQLLLDINLYLEEFFGSPQVFEPDSVFTYYNPDDYPSYGTTNPQAYSHLDLINAKGAWDYTKGNPNVKVGFVDIGCLLTHEDLVNKVTFVSGSTVGPHGTLVAGCIAAETDNNKGVAGIGFNCNILYTGYHSDPLELNMIELANAGARVINVSMGYCLSSGTNPSTTIGQSLINELYERGVILVSSAGNGNNGASCPDNNGKRNGYSYPASYDHVISVTSVCSKYNYGTTDGQGNKYNWKDVYVFDGNKPSGFKYYTHNDLVDISAPGWTVYTTDGASNSSYAEVGGTSFASPIVAGAVGLLLSINPCFTPDDIESILKDNAVNIDAISENVDAAGTLGVRLDAEASCAAAAGMYAEYTISNGQNITWSTRKHVKNKLTIESGGTLTITGTVNMGPNARIIVQRGAKLVLNGCTLSTGCPDSMWYGIEVWGDPTVDQHTTASHGWLVISNNTLIEHAKNAIYTGKLDNNMNWVWSYTGGGIIQASNSTFRNNGRCAEIMSFHNPKVSGKEPGNISYFSKCIFETTGSLHQKLYMRNGYECAPPYLMTVWDVKGLKLQGNTFRNTAYNTVYVYEMGAPVDRKGGALRTEAASCLISDYACGGCSTVHNTFSNLHTGIYNWGINATTSATIKGCVFTNVASGITLEGVRGDNISGNTFDTDGNLGDNVAEMSHIFTKGNSGAFVIAENNLKKNNGNIQNSFGVTVYNSSVTGCEIYKNTLRDLKWGLESDKDNQNLVLQCNDFNDLYRDWNSNRNWKDGQRPTEEVYVEGVGFYSPANLFDQSCNSTNVEHIANTVATSPTVTNGSIKYTSSFQYDTRPPQGTCSNASGGNPPVVLYNYAQALLGCASKTLRDNGAILNGMDVKRTGATERQALVDGGRTADLLALVNDVGTLVPALLDTLALYSPFLSDEVLIAFINRSGVSGSDLYDVLWANSGLTPAVFDALDNRVPPLSSLYYDDLALYADTLSPRDTVDAQVRSLLTQVQMDLNELLRNYEDSGLVDSIVYQLSLLDDVDSKGRYIHLLIEQGSLSTASSQLAALDTDDPEQADIFDFETIRHDLAYNGDNWFGVDSAQRAGLRELATHETAAAGFAQGVLVLIGDTLIEHMPDTTWPEPGGGSMQRRNPLGLKPVLPNSKVNPYAMAQMQAYPNPFSSTTIVECWLPGSLRGQSSIRVYNVQGVLQQEINMGMAKKGKLQLDMSHSASGLYILQLVNNNVVIKTQKLMRQP